MDIRLYKKAKLMHDPFNFEEFKQRKIKEKIEKERENRVKINRKLPVVNSELAKRLIEEKAEIKTKNKSKQQTNIMEDPRFDLLFKDPNFQINQDSPITFVHFAANTIRLFLIAHCSNHIKS